VCANDISIILSNVSAVFYTVHYTDSFAFICSIVSVFGTTYFGSVISSELSTIVWSILRTIVKADIHTFLFTIVDAI